MSAVLKVFVSNNYTDKSIYEKIDIEDHGRYQVIFVIISVLESEKTQKDGKREEKEATNVTQEFKGSSSFWNKFDMFKRYQGPGCGILKSVDQELREQNNTTSFEGTKKLDLKRLVIENGLSAVKESCHDNIAVDAGAAVDVTARFKGVSAAVGHGFAVRVDDDDAVVDYGPAGVDDGAVAIDDLGVVTDDVDAVVDGAAADINDVPSVANEIIAEMNAVVVSTIDIIAAGINMVKNIARLDATRAVETLREGFLETLVNVVDVGADGFDEIMAAANEAEGADMVRAVVATGFNVYVDIYDRIFQACLDFVATGVNGFIDSGNRLVASSFQQVPFLVHNFLADMAEVCAAGIDGYVAPGSYRIVPYMIDSEGVLVDDGTVPALHPVLAGVLPDRPGTTDPSVFIHFGYGTVYAVLASEHFARHRNPKFIAAAALSVFIGFGVLALEAYGNELDESDLQIEELMQLWIEEHDNNNFDESEDEGFHEE